MTGVRVALFLTLTLGVAFAALGQSSASYQIQSATVDSGLGGMSSSSYALGSAFMGGAAFAGTGGEATSASYVLQEGFVESVDIPIVKLSGTSLAFGADTVGSASSSETLTVTNDGAAALLVTGISSSSGYTETNNCGNLLASGASCTVSVSFNPSTIGSDPGTLNIASDADGSPSAVALSGTGEPAGDVPLPLWALGLLGAGLGIVLTRRRGRAETTAA